MYFVIIVVVVVFVISQLLISQLLTSRTHYSLSQSVNYSEVIGGT